MPCTQTRHDGFRALRMPACPVQCTFRNFFDLGPLRKGAKLGLSFRDPGPETGWLLMNFRRFVVYVRLMQPDMFFRLI